MSHGFTALIFLVACSKPGAPTADAGVQTAGPAIKSDKGVDSAAKTVRIGFLNDESGPGAVVGKPYALGKRIVADAINAGDSSLLPAGWRLEHVEKDHGYNPQKAVQEFQALRDDVLFIGTSFGTPNTLPLLPHLKRDNLLAFPASLSSAMADNVETPPLGPSYKFEAMRAVDYVVATGGDKAKLKPCIVYQNDDYGKDGLDGWKQATSATGLPLLAAQGIAPGQKDFTAVVTGLREAGCSHVLLTVLPSATGPLLGAALQVGFSPVWIGHMTSWIDRFFDPSVIPSEVFKNYVLVTSFPFWGEKVPGMEAFLAHYERFGKAKHPPDTYILAGYIQALLTVTALKRAIDSGDVTRAGFKSALQSINAFDAGGLVQPLDFTRQPYVTSTRTRILKPDFAGKTFLEVAPYASPSSLK